MPDLTYNEELMDAMVRHQIGVLRFSTSVRNQIWKLLDATEADIRQQIANVLRRGEPGVVTPANLQRMERLLKGIRKTRARTWSQISKELFDEMETYAVSETQFVASIMDTVFPVELGLTLPDPARLRAIVAKQAFNGQTITDMLAGIEAADIRRLEQGVRLGMTQGETIPQISRRLVGSVKFAGRDGMTEITRRNATAMARTMVNGVGAASRQEFIEANKDLAPQKVFIATLDSRTTPVCRKWDSSLHDVETGKTVSPAHMKGQPSPILPLHIGERSLFTPAVDGEVIGERPIRNFTQRQLVKEFGEQEGINVKVPKGQTLNAGRDAIPHGHKGAYEAFARQRMRELTGVVPAKTSYSQFLGRQSAQFQNDILGVTRGKLFRNGGLTLDRFVDRTGAEIPLADLAKFNADAFRAAGLDPSAFQ